MRWVALLRGVNVGGGNRLAMAELRDTAEQLGFADVATYIQSGNLAFEAPGTSESDEVELVTRLTAAIADRHGLAVPVVARSADEMGRIAESHPDAGTGLEHRLLHVGFLDAAPPANAALDAEPYVPDAWVVAGREIYVRYPNGSARSKLTIDVFERAFGVTGTARNLNTVRRLATI